MNDVRLLPRPPPYPTVIVLVRARYGRTMQQNWAAYRADPSRFTVAWQDRTMEHGAAAMHDLIRELLGLAPEADRE